MNDEQKREPSDNVAQSEVIKADNLQLEGDEKYAHVKIKRSSAAVRGAVWAAINSIVPTLLNSLVFIITSRYLLPHDFGIVALAVSAVSLISAVAPAAMGEAIVQQFNIKKSHLDTVFWLCMISAVLLYAVLILFTPYIVLKMGQPAVSELIPVLGLKLLFDLSAVVPNALITRAMSFHLIAFRTITATIFSSIICLTLLINGYGIWALALSQLAVSVTSCIAVFYGAKWKPGVEVSIKALRDLSQYSIFASGNRFLQSMNLDQIIIGTAIGPAALGIYNFSKRLFQMLNDVIAGALTSVSAALLSSLQNEKEKAREAFLFATFASSIVSFPSFVGLAAIAGTLIPFIFGDHWNAAIWPIRWFCLIGLMSCIGVIQSSLINSQGKNNWWFYYQLIRQIFTIATIFLLRDQGMTYIVMAIALQTVLFWPVTLVMVSKIINLRVTTYFRQFFEPLFASAVMLLAIWLIDYYFSNKSATIRLSSEVLVAMVIYTMMIFFLSREKLLLIAKSFLNRNK